MHAQIVLIHLPTAQSGPCYARVLGAAWSALYDSTCIEGEAALYRTLTAAADRPGMRHSASSMNVQRRSDGFSPPSSTASGAGSSALESSTTCNSRPVRHEEKEG